MIKRSDIDALCLRGETTEVDYKREQYLFIKAADKDKSELLKDVMAMANAERANPGYILIGVEELPNKSGKVVGVCEVDLIDDATLHQFVNAKVNAAIPFVSYVLPSGVAERSCIQVIEIDPCREKRPFYLRKNFGGLEANKVYMRDGTSTVVATPTQVREMGESAALGKARPVVALPEDVKVERDWSAGIVENASVEDLDPAAIARARKGFAEVHAKKVTEDEVLQWPVEMFLEKARLLVDGKITRAALVLLGKEESAAKLSPYVAQITWTLGDDVDAHAYEHFWPPFLLTTTDVYRKIRNFNLKIVPKDEMLPVTVPRYVEKVILEPLHNCLAHQDYNMQERILVTEFEDRIEFDNAGQFYEGRPEDYIEGARRPKSYRNRLLAEAMFELNMIDGMGYGIHDVYTSQRSRFLPMPDYDTKGGHVMVRVFGKVVDLAYSQLLMSQVNLPMADVFNLDRIQKHMPISEASLAHLRKMNYVEGRSKQLRVSSKIAAMTDKRAEYIQFRATEDANLKRMVIDYLTQYDFATRKDLDKLLINKMHEALSEQEKNIKVGNLLAALKKEGLICVIGKTRGAKWVLHKGANEQ